MRRGSHRRWLAAGVLAAGLAATVAVTSLAAAETPPAASPADTAPRPLAGPPPATGQQAVTETTRVSGTFDGGNRRFVGGGDLGDGGQDESQDPLFRLADGAVLENVILGAPAADGVHCAGSCTLRNVHWEDVGEDAATFRGTNAVVLIEGGSAAKAADKIFQDNRGAGGSVTITDFQVDDDFGKLYRSCGNCRTQAARTVTLRNITVTGTGDVLVGVNANLGDRAVIEGVTFIGGGRADLCDLFEGNNTGAEPRKIGAGPDGRSCIVTD
ncbi:pectate lyase [Micromonospora zingiberis]|uniref:Pectate lyase n=1 Tax=Micromonospora zingiberis TaxID=2053011 RepID=A0A4R0GGE3_9ACTN|nr:pectate lyase [Micromonospora zingiberis]TCB96454.1 pectate lyase [Micromonospora zingiberis]